MKSNIQQWETLRAVVDEGGYERAAEVLGRAQSTLSHTVKTLQQKLGVTMLKIEGRKATLTPAGKTLLDQARHLLTAAEDLERSARGLSRGIEAEITLAADVITPDGPLLRALCEFSAQFDRTRVELIESSLSGTDELLARRAADLVITPRVPAGFAGQELLRLHFVPVCHPDHPLLSRSETTLQDLTHHRQIVVRDSGSGPGRDAGWLGAQQRWTVSTMGMRLECLRRGLGFSWMPRQKVQDDLDANRLQILPLVDQPERIESLYLIKTAGAAAGPAATALADSLVRGMAEHQGLSANS